MDYLTLRALRRRHAAWRLLVADHAPMVAGFLYRTFIEPNVRTLPQQELASRLRDYLYHLREIAGEDSFPQSVDRYLDDWSSDDRAWMPFAWWARALKRRSSQSPCGIRWNVFPRCAAGSFAVRLVSLSTWPIGRGFSPY